MREGERAGGKVISEGEGERDGVGEGGAGDVGRRSYFADMAGGFGVSESFAVETGGSTDVSKRGSHSCPYLPKQNENRREYAIRRSYSTGC